MVVRAYTVCIGVTPECRQMESEMIRDGWGCVDEVDKAYHDNGFMYTNVVQAKCKSDYIPSDLNLDPNSI